MQRSIMLFFVLLLSMITPTTALRSSAVPGAPPTPDLQTVRYLHVATGENHTCGLSGDGLVYCWGGNTDGQLGNGTTNDRLAPFAVSGLSGTVALAAGASHTCALLGDGTARCWGANTYGQLGDGTTDNQRTPVAIG